jgi:hypothetical protein
VSTEFDASRRDFIVSITIAGGAFQIWPAMRSHAQVGANATPWSSVPVISFHMDQPYLDVTGTQTRYLPPEGARSAEPLCAYNETLLRYHHCYAV